MEINHLVIVNLLNVEILNIFSHNFFYGKFVIILIELGLENYLTGKLI